MKDEGGPLAVAKNIADGIKAVTDPILATQNRRVEGPTRPFLPDGALEGQNTRLSRSANRAGLVANIVALPQAGRELASAIRSGDGRSILEASGGAVSAVGNAVKGGIETAQQIGEFRVYSNVARQRLLSQAARDGVPVGRREANRIARQAANTVLDPRNRGQQLLSRAAAGEAASRLPVRPELRNAQQRAFQAGAAAVRREVGDQAARAGGRLVPGLNWVIAAADVASAVGTVTDNEASPVKKTTAVVTAVGSVMAATNLPLISQIGAGVSGVSGFVGALFG